VSGQLSNNEMSPSAGAHIDHAVYIPLLYLLIVSVITIVTKCPVTETITVGSKTICETSEIESTKLITTTHLDICTACSHDEPSPAAYPTAEQFPGTPPKVVPSVGASVDSAKPSGPVSFKGIAGRFKINFALGSVMLCGLVMLLFI
jgi:hypothetical protein